MGSRISRDQKMKESKLKVAIQSACRANQGAYFDKRGSFLTQKLLCDFAMKNKLEDSPFTWCCWIQHPQHYAITPGGKQVKERHSNTGERFSTVSQFRLCSIEQEWWIEDDWKTATFFSDEGEISRALDNLKQVAI